jgi:hypothetical protein
MEIELIPFLIKQSNDDEHEQEEAYSNVSSLDFVQIEFPFKDFLFENMNPHIKV